MGKKAKKGTDDFNHPNVSVLRLPQLTPWVNKVVCPLFEIMEVRSGEVSGWQVIVGVEPDQIEDISDLDRLLRMGADTEVKPRLPPKISGNDYCPCRSGKKFKKCCGASIARIV